MKAASNGVIFSYLSYYQNKNKTQNETKKRDKGETEKKKI